MNRNIAANAADIQLTPEHQRMLERLKGVAGAEFDREFINVSVRERRQAIRDFEAQAQVHGNNTKLRTLPQQP